VVNTPNGSLNVSKTMQEVAQFSVLVKIPPGTSGIVSVPGERLEQHGIA
jgi:hypothetical protein